MGKIVRQFIPPTDVSGCNGVEASSDRPIGAHDVHLSLALECGMRPSGKWPRSPQQGLQALVEPQLRIVMVLDHNSPTACMERRLVVFTVPLERRPKKNMGFTT